MAKAYYHAQSMLVTPFRVYGYSWPPASSSRPRTLDARRRKMDAFCYVLINLSDFVENNPWHTLQSYALHRRISFLAIDCIPRVRRRCPSSGTAGSTSSPSLPSTSMSGSSCPDATPISYGAMKIWKAWPTNPIAMISIGHEDTFTWRI